MAMRSIRRKDRILPDELAQTLLQKGEYGFLATVGEDGLPYCVPLSYVVLDGSVYFHSARDGRKVDNLLFCQQASFTVVGETKPVYIKDFSTYYESVMVFGPVHEVTDTDEKFRSLHALAEKYLPEHMDKAEPDIQRSFSRTAVFRLAVEHMTGKAKKPPTA